MSITTAPCALAALTLVGVVTVASAQQLTPEKAIYGTPAQRKERNTALRTITTADLKRHLEFLACDARAGRESGALGADQAAQYLAELMRKSGLVPMGDGGGYFQPFEGPVPAAMPRGTGPLGLANWVDVQEKPEKPVAASLAYDKDFRPFASSGCGFVQGGIVFASYGIVDPARGWDCYAGIDARGKIAVVLPGTPTLAGDKAFPEGDPAGTLARKLAVARERGVVALVVADPALKAFAPCDPAERWPPAAGPVSDAIPVIQVTAGAAEKLLAPIKVKLAARMAEIAAAGAPKSYPPSAGSAAVEGWAGPRVRLAVSSTGPFTGGFKNVLGLIEGHHPELKKQLVVVGGHYDHVGMGAFGSRGGQGQVHNGADDNASGTSGVLEIAEAISLACRLDRSVLVVLFDAEERGLLGSKHYTEAPKWPLADTVAMFNLDMISRNGFKQIFIGAAERNRTIHQLLLEINKQYQIELRFDGMEPFTNRSDQFHFLEKGIPGIFFFGGLHGDYHTAGDDPDKCNLDKSQAISQLVFYLVYTVANLPERP